MILGEASRRFTCVSQVTDLKIGWEKKLNEFHLS